MTELTQGGRQVHSLATRHNGVLFRSALEAKWAMALDRLGLEWEYEPEAVILSNGTTYLPDFRLPRAGQFIEVKPVALITDGAIRKMTLLCELTSDLAPTPVRPEFQVVWCNEAGFTMAFGCAAGEPHTKALAFSRPEIMRCPACDTAYFSTGMFNVIEGTQTCHACGQIAPIPSRCGHHGKSFYGVHNG